MKFHCLKHVFFEGPENFENWALSNGHTFKTTNAYENQFPENESYDVLVLMGGPMSANDVHLDWLQKEKRIIEQAISKHKKVIGVCLGAQLMASALGARVYKNHEKEIGWFPVYLTEDAKKNNLWNTFHDSFNVFHWHGETFDLPQGCTHLLQSEACLHQAFSFNEQMLGFQFHMEGTQQSLIQMMENSRSEMTSGKYIQEESMIRTLTEKLTDPTTVLFNKILDRFFQ